MDELIDWNNIPDDPIFQLVFPQEGMLNGLEGIDDFHNLIEGSVGNQVKRDQRILLRSEMRKERSKIHENLNPHPAGQMDFNKPNVNNFESENGIQHK